MYKGGTKWWPVTPEERALCKVEQDERKTTDTWEDLLAPAFTATTGRRSPSPSVLCSASCPRIRGRANSFELLAAFERSAGCKPSGRGRRGTGCEARLLNPGKAKPPRPRTRAPTSM
jgi:hypothetical protein